MQEYTSTGEIPVPPEENLTTGLWAAARQDPQQPAIAYRVGDRFEQWSTARFVEEVRAVAKGLLASGIEPGQRIALYSETRPEWTVIDFAIWAAGGVSVPIYETSSPEQIGWILKDSDAVMLIVSTTELRGVYGSVAESAPSCEQVVVIDEGGLDELTANGAGIDDEQLDARAASVDGSDVATIVYTSGTTGMPKGCVVTHHNFVWDAAQVAEAEKEFFQRGKRTVLFLPLAHIFARVIQVTCVRTGVLLGFSSGVDQIAEEFRIFQPDFLVAVPRVFEKIYNAAQHKAHAEGKGAIFDRAAATAERWSRQRQDGAVSLPTKLLHAVFDKLVYTKLRAATGGNVRYAVSGGAALGERLGHFFNGAGITVLEGYGLTETTAGACLGRPSAFRVGTVGRPVPGASVRVDEGGELLVAGDHVFRGYYNDEAATAEILTDDGWLRTGDLAEIDDDGFVRITGRRKEIIVTANGKNVAPAVLEDRMRAHALVSQSMVVGDGRPFIAALITVDREGFERWAQDTGRAGASVADLTDDPDLRAEVQKAVDEANQAVSRAESIRSFRILAEDFEVGEELSQKMSVKRHVVAERYGDVIEDIYSAPRPS